MLVPVKQVRFGIILPGFILFSIISSCSRNSNEPSYESAPGVEEEVKYEEAKLTVEEMEKKSPLDFLEAGGQYRPALIGGDFLIEGYIRSSATVATYKDITVQFTYYSKTESVISTKTKTFYEFIRPGGTHNFRFKIYTPSATSTIGWEVISAENI